MMKSLASVTLPAVAASILLKVALSAPVAMEADRILDRLADHMSARGVVETARISLTAEGTYRAARYATLTCREALIAMPILRNSEAKGLMDTPKFPIRYAVDGALHNDLPHLSLWWHILTIRLGLQGDALPPLAVVADPACIPDLDSLIL